MGIVYFARRPASRKDVVASQHKFGYPVLEADRSSHGFAMQGRNSMSQVDSRVPLARAPASFRASVDKRSKLVHQLWPKVTGTPPVKLEPTKRATGRLQ